MATLFFWAVFGALAGAFAKLVLWDDRRESLPVAVVLGIAGALAGGFVRIKLGGADSPGVVPLGFDGFSMLLALVGAMALLLGYYALVERRTATRPAIRRAA